MKQLIELLLNELKREKIEYQTESKNNANIVTVALSNRPITIIIKRDFIVIECSIATVHKDKHILLLECINTANANFNYLRLCIEDNELKVKSDCHLENETDVTRCIDRINYIQTFIKSFDSKIKDISK